MHVRRPEGVEPAAAPSKSATVRRMNEVTIPVSTEMNDRLRAGVAFQI